MSDHVRDSDAKRHEQMQICIYDMQRLNREMTLAGKPFDEVYAALRQLARERLGRDYRGQKWAS